MSSRTKLSRLEYHIPVRHSIPASVALFSLVALPVVFLSSSHAQINGTPASVTSPGFGGRPINGAPPSVTSLGQRGFIPNSGVTFSQNGVPGREVHHHHHHFVEYTPPIGYAIPVPYAVDIADTDDNAGADDSDANYQGGPTIFDRRGLGAESYVPPVKYIPRPRAAQSEDSDPPAPEPPQVLTLLIFKDGHKIEVGNYAIVGNTLFDLTPGHTRKVPVADLDLDATHKQNDDRGVIFQLPPQVQAN